MWNELSRRTRNNAIGNAKNIVPKLPSSCNISAGPANITLSIAAPLLTPTFAQNTAIPITTILSDISQSSFEPIILMGFNKANIRQIIMQYNKGKNIILPDAIGIFITPIFSLISVIIKTTNIIFQHLIIFLILLSLISSPFSFIFGNFYFLTYN